MPGPNEKEQEDEENTTREYERMVDQMYGRDEEEKDEKKDK